MAPSGGFRLAPGQRKMQPFVKHVVLMVVILMLQSKATYAAAKAKLQYNVDDPSDCIHSGYLDVPRDQITYIRVRGSGASGLACTLRFSPEESGDTLSMWFNKGSFVGNCDVSLTMRMTGNGDSTLGCRTSSLPPSMEAADGKGMLIFRRGRIDSTTYSFTVGVQARRTQDPAGAGNSDTEDIGLIVGIVAGAVLLLIFFLVLCICCYRRSRRDGGFKVQDQNNQPVGTFENGKMGFQAQGYTDESPSSERKLLTKNGSDYDVEEALKPKSALDRFGPTPVRRSDRPQTEKARIENDAARQRNAFKSPEDSEGLPQGSPVLDALRRDPKFRRSFHDNEMDADDRANRISGSENSSVSYNSNGVPLPPKLPPVPRSPQRSPSPQRKGEIAGIFRARPSSSSSELAKQLEGMPINDDTLSEFVPSPPGIDKKNDTRHVLRPDRGERKSRSNERRRRKDDDEESDDSAEERKHKKREKEKRAEERERQRRQEEEEDREEEERRRKKKEREKKRRQEEEEEEEERRERRRREKERDKEDDRLEGRFKKSASGRRSKGKGPRMGRSKSTSNALDEIEDNYQRSRSKSPSSVRSLNFVEDDDDYDDLDSNYMPFKRAGSKTSLYASRSSLYGRRRKNSMGETISLSSYAYDDLDSRYGDFDRKSVSRQDKERMFRSTGELDMHGATAQVVREVATQTDSSKAVYVYGRKTLAKSRSGKMYSRGCQTGRARRDSNGSARSSRSSRMKKSRSQESLRKHKRSRSRNLDQSYDSDNRRSRGSRSKLDESYGSSEDRGRRSRSKSRNLDYSDDDDASHRGRKKKHHRSKSRGLGDEYEDDDHDRQSSKGKGKPKARPRKSTAASVDLSDSDGGRSAAASSVAPSYIAPAQPNPYGAQYVPVMYPPPAGMTFLPTAPGGPPAGHQAPLGPKPPIAPKPKKSKWDQLVEMTDGEKQRQRQRGDSPSESMMSSVYSHAPAPKGGNQPTFYPPPSYTTAQKYPNPPRLDSTISSAYPDSSGMPLSGPVGHKYSYAPSESEI